jgi:broad specificity phosphatase PhoE
MHRRLPNIYLMRHGETEWSVSGQHTGRADISLTPNGQKEARRLREQIQGVAFQHLFVSPLRRALQTCQSAGFGEKAEIEPDISEWDNGDYEGKTHREIDSVRPGWNLFRDGCPNGESPEQITNRVDRVIVKLRKLNGDIALFTHGHFGRVLGARWIGLSVEFAERFLLNTASLSILSYQHNDEGTPAILQWNSTSQESTATLKRPRWGVASVPCDVAKRKAIERWENEGGELVAPR